MPSTAGTLRTAQQIVSQYGLTDLDNSTFFTDSEGHFDPIGAVYRAATGETPDSFRTDVVQALALIRANAEVMNALAWISTVLPTEAPTDSTGADDHVEHISAWFTSPDFFLGRHPGEADVIEVLGRAAQAADALTAFPSQRVA
ncbi:hypothetical protein [Streptomyces sp. NPDC047939]|uniref:DUF6197 family protein n=1 Tax=Streptomyces sp. NPDC047939 TaxID=3155381 RepID=UPI003437051D